MKNIQNQIISYEIPDVSSQNLATETSDRNWRILITEPESLQAPLIDLLNKIINAMQIEAEVQVQILPLLPESNYWLLIQENPFILNIISFGIPPSYLGLQGFDNKHHVYHFQNKKILFADELQNYSTESSKKLLWTGLKEMKKLS